MHAFYPILEFTAKKKITRKRQSIINVFILMECIKGKQLTLQLHPPPPPPHTEDVSNQLWPCYGLVTQCSRQRLQISQTQEMKSICNPRVMSYEFSWTSGPMTLRVFYGSPKCFLGQETLISNIFQEPQNCCILSQPAVRNVS